MWTQISSAVAGIIRRAGWGSRLALRVRPSDPDEVLFRLRLLRPAPSHAPRHQDFQWGRFEYLSVGNLQAQYKDIYVRRQYAFECDAPCPVIVDCGGNVGLSVVWFKQNYPDSRVIVYEADPDIAKVLSRNVTRLGLSDVTVHPVAVWTENGRMGFHRRGPDAGSLSSNGALSVATIRLAECLPEHVDLLKLDIEGGEFEVLRDLHQTQALRRVDKVIAECHVTADLIDEFIEFVAILRDSGMQFVIGTVQPKRMLAGKEAITPFPGIPGGQCLLELYGWREHSRCGHGQGLAKRGWMAATPTSG